MELSTAQSGVYTLTLDEKFDFNHVGTFRTTYEKIDPKGLSKIIINFRNTRYMDSSALGMLLNLHNTLGGGSVRIELSGANEKISKILKISRFDTKFTIN
ncbi:STAS domain-containing protein [Saccharophagus degradans]|uniref:Sulfate transporter/antisigma-factor antagonist STAS n=1 Tax=Saccharophagus degradans (strain 2-40 / ATCC 43961 / DSM 17024) TaxID=203122 RepID=Q21G05_SACD2|nr:STAS domain-containing protein [Saccharophagus degradans]ABD82374.1 Sulfate transporter/antisigma-factor antagonist STAS [Saccharophagus degradans 2-40]